MLLKGPVLAALDMGNSSVEALRQGEALAVSLGAPLHVCHVLPELLRVRMLFPQLKEQDAFDAASVERAAVVALSRRVEEITGRPPSSVALEIAVGSPHAGILLTAERVGAGLIVLGPGPGAQRVARGASCPVLVARSSPAGMVLGATDFSDPALPAVEGAAREAARRQVPLALVHSLDLDPIELAASPGLFPGAVMLPLPVEEIREEVRIKLQECLDKFGVGGDVRVLEGPAAQAISKAAGELQAGLVVVGTRGKTGFARLALGSTAEGVLASAPCSVLVVRLGE